MDIENRNCSQAEGRTKHAQGQAKEHLMARGHVKFLSQIDS